LGCLGVLVWVVWCWEGWWGCGVGLGMLGLVGVLFLCFLVCMFGVFLVLSFFLFLLFFLPRRRTTRQTGPQELRDPGGSKGRTRACHAMLRRLHAAGIVRLEPASHPERRRADASENPCRWSAETISTTDNEEVGADTGVWPTGSLLAAGASKTDQREIRRRGRSAVETHPAGGPDPTRRGPAGGAERPGRRGRGVHGAERRARSCRLSSRRGPSPTPRMNDFFQFRSINRATTVPAGVIRSATRTVYADPRQRPASQDHCSGTSRLAKNKLPPGPLDRDRVDVELIALGPDGSPENCILRSNPDVRSRRPTAHAAGDKCGCCSIRYHQVNGFRVKPGRGPPEAVQLGDRTKSISQWSASGGGTCAALNGHRDRTQDKVGRRPQAPRDDLDVDAIAGGEGPGGGKLGGGGEDADVRSSEPGGSRTLSRICRNSVSSASGKYSSRNRGGAVVEADDASERESSYPGVGKARSGRFNRAARARRFSTWTTSASSPRAFRSLQGLEMRRPSG